MTDLISSKQNPKIKWVKKLRDQRKARDAEGLFIVETPKYIHEMCRQKPDHLLALFYLEGSPPPKNIPILATPVTEAVLKEMSSVKTPQPQLAIFKIPEVTPQSMNTIKANKKGKMIILDQIQTPSNCGSIIRSAAAFGIDIVALTDGSADPFHPDAIRAMAGTTFGPVIINGSLTIQRFLSPSWTLFQLTADAPNQINTISWPQKTALVMGSESHGITSDFLKHHSPSQKIAIPMQAHVDSLNVSVAAGIAMASIH